MADIFDPAGAQMNPQFQGILNAIRQTIRGPQGAFGTQNRQLAQNISLRPGLRGSGVGLIPKIGLAGAQLGAEAGAASDLLGQQEQQRFAAEQAAKEQALRRDLFGQQMEADRQAASTANRRGFQNAIRGSLLASLPKYPGRGGSSTAVNLMSNPYQ